MNKSLLTILCVLVSFVGTGCSAVSVNVTKPDGTNVRVVRGALMQDVEGSYSTETTNIQLKSNASLEALKAGIELGKALRP